MYQSTFVTLLMTGTILAVSANSWFTAWLGLEINLMGLIPLILVKLNSNSTEAAIKYFLAQAIASIILVLIALTEKSSFQTYIILDANILILSALAIKAGIAPFHF
jgi:NADH-ubiquinone oxidoreductase chain 2